MASHQKSPADISVIIPAYNRVPLLLLTLDSVVEAAQAASGLTVETVVVDDGSDQDLRALLTDRIGQGPANLRVIRQPNQGSIVARRTGLAASSGEFVLFLDSDDLIRRAKLVTHVKQMRASGSDVSYSNTVIDTLTDNGLQHGPASDFPAVSTPAELFLQIQPAPHSPVYRREFAQAASAASLIPPDRIFDPTGDTWLYFNAALLPGTVEIVSDPLSASVVHESGRYSNQWERLGVSALGLSLLFAMKCPREPWTEAARAELGAAALRGYRRLPKHFHRDFERLTLRLFEISPRTTPLRQLGGRAFSGLGRVVGPAIAARLMRLWQARRYAPSQTLPRTELDALFTRTMDRVRAQVGAGPLWSTFGI